MGNYVNYQNVIDQLLAFGLLVDRLEVGRSSTKRVKVDTAKCPVDREKWKTAGWYKLNEFTIEGSIYIVGSFGYWKGSDNNAQKVEWKKEWVDNLTSEQKQAMADAHKASIKKAEEERKREIEHCANQAQTNWLKLKTEGESSYLTKKQVGAFGVKFHPKKDTIVIPVQDIKGKLFALQIIRGGLSQDSKIPAKQFWPRGSEIKGHFHVIGTLSGAKTIFIAEGYATGASVHMATGFPVVVAFNANNLTPVTKAIAAAHKYAQIVICADDDYLRECPHCKEWTLAEDPNCSHCGKPHKKRNDGVYWAEIAATSVGGAWVKPDFMVASVDIRNSEKLTDFNDLHVHPQGGLHLVTSQLAQYIGQTQPQPKTATVVGGAQTGEGDRRQAVSVMSIDEIVQRFIHVDDDLGDHVYDTWTRSVVKTKKVQSLLPPKVRWEEIKSNHIWQSRAVYRDQIGFDPTGNDSNIVCNRWKGWPTKPANLAKPEDGCSQLLCLLFTLCSEETNKPVNGEQAVFQWIIKWLAYPIQNPGAKLDTALIFHGPQGTGKNLFFGAYGEIYGEHFSLITQDTMEDQFNSDWVDQKLFVLADEIVAMQERTHVKNKLKTMVTGKTVRINQKMIAAYTEKNFYNMVFLSNELNPVVLEKNDRRYLVVWTPEKRGKDYYQDVKDEIDNGGIQALHQFLLNVDLTGFNPNASPPMTHAKQDLIYLNLDAPQAFYHQWMDGDVGIPFMPCDVELLFSIYQKWCFKKGERYPGNDRRFIASLGGSGAYSEKEHYFTTYNKEKSSRKSFIIPKYDDYLVAKALGVDCAHPKDDEMNGGKSKRDMFTTYFVETRRIANEEL